LAEVHVDGSEVVVTLTAFEKIEAVHGEIRLALASLQGADVLDDAVHAVHGLRAPGTGVPGYVAVGTYRNHGRKVFAVVHHDARRGVRLRFRGLDFDEVIVGCDDPEALVARLPPTTGD
jgi:hypothetical protein